MSNDQKYIYNDTYSISKEKVISICKNKNEHKNDIIHLFKLFYVDKTLRVDISDKLQRDFIQCVLRSYFDFKSNNGENSTINHLYDEHDHETKQYVNDRQEEIKKRKEEKKKEQEKKEKEKKEKEKKEKEKKEKSN
jgi:uncharacterized membrane protein YukC